MQSSGHDAGKGLEVPACKLLDTLEMRDVVERAQLFSLFEVLPCLGTRHSTNAGCPKAKEKHLRVSIGWYTAEAGKRKIGSRRLPEIERSRDREIEIDG